MGSASTLSVIALAAASGCDRYPALTDAAGDSRTRDGGIDVDPNFAVTATYLDWDSTAASPCPIAGAPWFVAYDTSRHATTDENGMFTIELASYLSELRVDNSNAHSSCTSWPNTYDTPGVAFIEPLLHYAGAHVVLRSFSTAQRTSFYSSIGAPFETLRGQLLVHIDGPARTVSISSAHDAAQAFDGATWSAGEMGADVFFPNITLAEPPQTTITVAGGAMGTGAVTLEAGAITYVTVISN